MGIHGPVNSAHPPCGRRGARGAPGLMAASCRTSSRGPCVPGSAQIGRRVPKDCNRQVAAVRSEEATSIGLLATATTLGHAPRRLAAR